MPPLLLLLLLLLGMVHAAWWCCLTTYKASSGSNCSGSSRSQSRVEEPTATQCAGHHGRHGYTAATQSYCRPADRLMD